MASAVPLGTASQAVGLRADVNEDMLVRSFDPEDVGDRQHVKNARQGLQHRRREPVLVFLGQSRRELDLHGIFTSNLRSLSCVSTITQ